METAKLNSRQQITELGLGTSQTDTSLWKVNYEYGEIDASGNLNQTKNNGNIAKQTISFAGLANPFVQTYKYDSVNRLTEARETNGANQIWIQTFGYDRYGNRTAFSQQGGITPAVQPTIDQNTNRFVTGQGYVYDFNGNIITDPAYSGRSFTFNGDNKQVLVKDVNNNVVGQYFYDGDGKRVKKVTNLETTIFVYSGGKLVAEYSTAAPPDNPTINYTATDSLGSPRVITDKMGNVISRRDFMPFGEELLPDANYRTTNQKYSLTGDSVRQKFTGYQKDLETGLDFAEARYYNNQHGRFTAVDPLLASGKSANPQTFNRYVYTGNNPINITDPLGLDWYFNKSGNKYDWYDKEKKTFLWGGGGLTDDWKIAGNTSIDATGAGSFNYQSGNNWITLDANSFNWSSSTSRPYVPATPGTDNNAIRALSAGVTQGVNDGIRGIGQGVGNGIIGMVNTATNPLGPAGAATGVPNPFAIHPFTSANARQASYSSASATGFQAGLALAGGTLSSGSSLSVVPENVAATTSSRAFFSGAGTEARAIEEGFQTLGQTRAGQNLQRMIDSKNIPWERAEPMWTRLSATWARGVPNGSTVNVFLNNPRAGSIWANTERKILLQKGVNIIER